MLGSYPKIAFEILRKEGPIEFSRQSKNFAQFHLIDRPVFWFKYREIRPKPREILLVDPTNVDYRIASRHIPDDAPPYGIIGGKWDLNKSHWKKGFFYGLIERFEEDKQWEDTIYYQTLTKKLEKGKSIGVLDGPQTISNFKNYLTYLDKLYGNIKQNGYDKDSIITVSIGRNGEWIVHSGNHRLTIARIIGIEEVPLKIKYRHKQWQDLRDDIDNNGLAEKHDKKLRDHPDIQNVLN